MADKTTDCTACEGTGTHVVVEAAAGPVTLRLRNRVGFATDGLSRTITATDGELSAELFDPGDLGRAIGRGAITVVQE